MALLAVILGAFGAHILEEVITPDQLQSFQTGVRYQFYHALALLIIGILPFHFKPKRLFDITGWLFFIGIICFSGSIYLLACRDLLGLESWRWLGPITPFGGSLLIIGWTLLFFSFFKTDSKV